MGSERKSDAPDENGDASFSDWMLGNDSKTRALRPPAWAARFLGVPVEWVIQAAERGELPCIHLEHHVRFDPIELKTWVRQQGATFKAGALPDTQTTARGERPVSLAPLRRELRALRSEVGLQNQAAVPVLEAARRLGCSRARVFELLKKGELKRATSFGKATMVDTASIDALRARVEEPTLPPTRAPRAKKLPASSLSYGERIDVLGEPQKG